MLRLDTTLAAATGDSWQPVDEAIFLQLEAEDPAAIVRIDGRVHADAPWTRVHTFHGGSIGFLRLAAPPFMRVEVMKNTAGRRIRLWDNG